MTIDTWKNAVVHLECAEDSMTTAVLLDFQDKMRSGEVDASEFGQLIMDKTRDRRSQGTATFIKDGDKRYLITAKYVVMSENSEKLASPIFNVQRFGQPSRSDYRSFLMNLSTGVDWLRPYVVSNDELDLAVISLNSNSTTEFAEYLLKEGYIPIDITRIVDDVISEGQDIMAVGFPNTSLIEQIQLTRAEHYWQSSSTSLPVFSYGKIAMTHEDLPYFWGDISIYPGNSGGPIIKNGNLVGIVSAQSLIHSEVISQDRQTVPLYSINRIPFAQIIKAKHMLSLLEAMKQKENNSDFV